MFVGLSTFLHVCNVKIKMNSVYKNINLLMFKKKKKRVWHTTGKQTYVLP